MDLGSKIKKLRIEKVLKQSELAEKAGISRVAVGNYERNERVPNAEILSRIAIALDTTPSELMGWDVIQGLEVENLKPEIKEELVNAQYNFIKEASNYWSKTELEDFMKIMNIDQFVEYLLSVTKDINKISFNSFINYLSKTFPNEYKIGITNLIELYNKVNDFTEFNINKLSDKNKEGE